jgi:hypothetical protein
MFQSNIKTKGAFYMSVLSEINSLCAGPFTDEEKRECLPTVETILYLAEKARREGVLALEQEANKPGTPFFLQKAILLIVDATDPRLVAEMLRNFILSSHYQGAELLKRVLMMNGALSIQAGENPRIIAEKLLSLMGEQFYDEASAYIWLNPKTPDAEMKEYFADMETETYPDGTNLLEEVFSKLSDQYIQIILRMTDEHVFLLAFRGSSKKIQRRMCDNLSMRIARRMVNASTKEPMPATDEIIRAQQTMLNTLKQTITGEEAIAGRGSEQQGNVVSVHVYHTLNERSWLNQEEINSLLSKSAGETSETAKGQR